MKQKGESKGGKGSHLTLDSHLIFVRPAVALMHISLTHLPVSLHPGTGTQYKEGEGLLWRPPGDKAVQALFWCSTFGSFLFHPYQEKLDIKSASKL